jgi:hypothetical protein
MNRGECVRVEEGGGDERGGKETDGCPLTLPPLQRHGITTREDCQEVARSALVKEIELKRAVLMWRAALGCLWWNYTIFDFAYSCICSSHWLLLSL